MAACGVACPSASTASCAAGWLAAAAGTWVLGRAPDAAGACRASGLDAGVMAAGLVNTAAGEADAGGAGNGWCGGGGRVSAECRPVGPELEMAATAGRGPGGSRCHARCKNKRRPARCTCRFLC